MKAENLKSIKYIALCTIHLSPKTTISVGLLTDWKQKIKNLIKLHIENNFWLPDDLKIIFPKDMPISKERLIKEAYKDFLKDVGMTDVELDNYLKRRAVVLASNLGVF